MNTQRIYAIVSIMLAFVILSLVSWSVFVGKQKKEIEKKTKNTFGTVFDQPITVHKYIDELKEKALNIQQEIQNQVAFEFKPEASELVYEPTAGFEILFDEIKDNLIVDTIAYTLVKNGHVFFATYAQKPSLKRVLQVTIPSVQESLFSTKGEWVIRRFLNENENIVSAINTLPQKEEAKTLAADALFLKRHPLKDLLLFLKKEKPGLSLYTYDIKTEKQQEIWSSYLTQWEADFWGDDIIIWQRGAYNLSSSIFLINPQNGSETVLADALVGLEVKPFTDNLAFISTTKNRKPKLQIINKVGEITELDIETFASKCAFLEKDFVLCFVPEKIEGELPDDWYMGNVIFKDSIYKINIKTGEKEKIYPQDNDPNFQVDATHVKINKSKTAVYFIDKKTGSLWRVKIKPPYEKNTEINSN